MFLFIIALPVLSTDAGRYPGGSNGGGLKGTATASAWRDASILATRFSSRILATCPSSPGSTAEADCHRFPGAGERVVGLALFGTGAMLDDPGPDSRGTDFNVTLCLEGERPAAKTAFGIPLLTEVARSVPICCDDNNFRPMLLKKLVCFRLQRYRVVGSPLNAAGEHACNHSSMRKEYPTFVG